MGFFSKKILRQDGKFGPPYAVLNISKLGLRYFRICIEASEKSRQRLIDHFTNHPNVGWVFSAEGWCNVAIGIWAQSNSEINEISSAIRKELNSNDKIIYQSELTSLHSFGNRPVNPHTKAMTIVDSVFHAVDLTPTELDYLKIATLDSSISPDTMSELLNIPESNILEIKTKLTDMGVIVGYQDRINYAGIYYKIFVDSLSRKHESAVNELFTKLWNDNRCIYIERANGKYDIEFEIIVERKSELKEFLVNFGEYQTLILTKNLYTNLYPLSKVANLKQIKDTLHSQTGSVIDFRNSKLWYLNHKGAQAYLDIYENKKYFEVMEKSELDLFDDVISYVQSKNPSTLFTLIDIGSGNGLKGRIFMEKMGESNMKAYYPVDVQPIELAAALQVNENGTYAKHPVLLDIENLASRFPLKLLPQEKQIYGFLGGTYGNFQGEIINMHLKKIITPDSSSIFLVTMPIIAETKSAQEIIDSYTNTQVEDIAFGPLSQLGFTKDVFTVNSNNKDLHLQLAIEEKRLVTSFVLAQNVVLDNRTFEKGTIFKMTSSWKPTLAEFQSTLERDFTIEKVFSNSAMAIALIGAK